MNSRRALCAAMLLAGVAGLAPAQSITLTTSPAGSITYGQPVSLTAVYAATPKFPEGDTCAGPVEFFDGDHGTSLGTEDPVLQFLPLPSTCVATLPSNPSTSAFSIGTHDLSACIEPQCSTIYITALTVNQAPTTSTLVASPNPSTAGQAVTMIATVSPAIMNSAGAAGPTSTVSFADTIGGITTQYAPVPLSHGVATFTTTALTLGTHMLYAVYNGDSNYLDSTTPTVSLTVYRATTTSLLVAPTSSTPGQSVGMQATVSPSTATGTVTFLDGATPIGSAPLIVVDTTAFFHYSNLSSGSHSLTAAYGGDASDAPSVSQAVTVTVGQTATTTSLKAVPASSSPGQSVALTATVSPSTATGTVTFLDGSTAITSPEPLSAGMASVQVSTLSGGSHSLSASYSGDTGDAPSTSAGVTESVGLTATTTTLKAAPASSKPGQTVTLTATVSPSAATGTVTFLDGSTAITSPEPLSGGTASVQISNLSAGSHSLSASYSGDTNDAQSTSATVTESVTGSTGGTTPNPVSVSPASGGGSGEVMSFVFNDASGWQDLGVVNVLINNVLDGRNACYLAYSRPAGVLYLVEDDGGTLSTGLALGGAGSVSNSQCTVAGAASAAEGSGNALTLILNLTFTAGFGGNKVVYLAAGDVAGGNSGWQALGVWQATFTPTGTIAVVSLTSARSTAAAGTPQTLTATLTDSHGVGDFGVVNVLANNFIDGRQACYLAYVASTNTLLLVDNGGDAGGPFAGSMVLNGGAATIQNSQCSVNGVGSVAAKGGNTLTLILNVTFQVAFDGNQIVWVAGRDQASGNNTDWQAVGTTTVE